MAGSAQSIRKHADFAKLMQSGYKVELNNDSVQDFDVHFAGPKNTLYEGGVFKVRVHLPEQYPFHPPSITFQNRVFHPNVDEWSGSVCLDVINQTWTPMYSLVNVFDVFLPQLLTYPNMSDPLHSSAASMWMKNREQYENKVRDYVRMYAQAEPAEPASSKRSRCESAETAETAETNSGGDDDVSELSDASDMGDLDMSD